MPDPWPGGGAVFFFLTWKILVVLGTNSGLGCVHFSVKVLFQLVLGTCFCIFGHFSCVDYMSAY